MGMPGGGTGDVLSCVISPMQYLRRVANGFRAGFIINIHDALYNQSPFKGLGPCGSSKFFCHRQEDNIGIKKPVKSCEKEPLQDLYL